MAVHLIRFGGDDQDLVHVPSQRVSTATYEIQDFYAYISGSASYIIASGSATLDSVDTTTDVASGPEQADPRKVNVSSTTDVTASYRYVISHTDTSSSETFTAESLTTDDFILAETPLLASYPTGSAVQGIRLTATFPAASANDNNLFKRENPLRVVWSYEINGVTHHAQEQIRLVRHDLMDIGIDEIADQIQSAWPDYATRFDSHYKLTNAIEFALQEVASLLLAKNLRPEEYLMGGQGKQAMFWRVMQHLAQLGNAPGNREAGEFYVECKERFQEAFNNLTIGYPGEEVSKVRARTDFADRPRYLGLIKPL